MKDWVAEGQAKDLQEEITALRKEIAKLVSENEALRADLSNLRRLVNGGCY